MANYYTDPLKTPREEPSEEWSWDEFLGGLAKGVVGGASIGINLREARDKASAARLAELRRDPEFYLSTYDAIRKPPIKIPEVPSAGIPGRDMSLEAGADIGDLGALGIPERTTPEQMGVDLGAIKEARDRELARQRFAQSPRAKKFLESVTDTEAAAIRGEEDLKKRGLVGESIKKAAEVYGTADDMLNRFETQREALEIRIKSAVDAGDTARATSLRAQAAALIKQGADWKAKMDEAIVALEKHGFTEEDYNTILEPGKREEAIDKLIRQGARTGRTRRPGSR